MTLTAKPTQNPAVYKYQANRFLVEKGPYEYHNIDEASESPLAQQLFHLPFVKAVYISGNFVAIEKYDIVVWEDVKDELGQQLVDYLNEGMPIVNETVGDGAAGGHSIYSEMTPNPAVMKFVSNKLIAPDMFEFKNIDEAVDSPLATRLFEFPYVKQVFMDENYVSVTKFDRVEWDEINAPIRAAIQEFLNTGKPAVSAAPSRVAGVSGPAQPQSEGLDETSQKIVQILDEYVKPAVAGDGGNILFQGYEEEEGRVHVILQGACSGCPSSTFTLKNGIETMLKNMLGDKVREVVAING